MKQEKRSKGALLWLSAAAGKAKLYIAVLLAEQVLLGLSGVYFALQLRSVVNCAVDGDRSGFFRAIAVFAALAAVQIALRAVDRFVRELCRSELENRLKSRLFSALMRRDYAAVTAVHSGEWMNRLSSDTQVAADGMTDILPGAAGMTVKMAGALIAILWLEPRFMYILIPGGIIMLCVAAAFRKFMKRLHKEIRERDGKLRIFMSERLSSLMVVKSFAKERISEDMADGLMAEHKDARMKRNRYSNFFNTAFGTAMNGVYVLGAFFCGYGILTGTMSYGNLMAVLQLVSQVQSPFANITGYLPKYAAMLASAERLMEAESFEEDAGVSVSEKETEKLYTDELTAFGLDGASFSYKNEGDTAPTVVSGLNIEIKKGEYTAFTGPSGCGKSTVLKLLMCLYPLNEGEVYLRTERGTRALTAAERGLFAYVPQGNQLLSGTIREIVAFGDGEKMHDEERLQRALKIACAEEFVSELENGADTVLGERGTGLSEGQMQRIAIARAIFSGHPVLLLDEATSSLDEATERRLLDNLRSMTDTTVIIVTHRPAVLSICDKHIEFGK